MTAIAIRPATQDSEGPRYRAVAGERQTVGNTMGEALDALAAEWGDSGETLVLIQRFQPDRHFPRERYDRLQALLARRSSSKAEEREELEALIDDEIEATLARTDRPSLAGPA